MTIANQYSAVGQSSTSSNKASELAGRDLTKLDDKKLREVSREFESLFVNELFKSMRKTVPQNELLDGGMRKDIFEDMLYSEYAKMTSDNGGIGLGDMIYRYVKESQGKTEGLPHIVKPR